MGSSVVVHLDLDRLLRGSFVENAAGVSEAREVPVEEEAFLEHPGEIALAKEQ